jgi:hypothetical protein
MTHTWRLEISRDRYHVTSKALKAVILKIAVVWAMIPSMSVGGAKVLCRED